jgi:hypothetical protein
LLDVTPLDPGLVKGSHGRPTDRAEDGPVFLTSEERLAPEGKVAAAQLRDLILDHIFED